MKYQIKRVIITGLLLGYNLFSCFVIFLILPVLIICLFQKNYRYIIKARLGIGSNKVPIFRFGSIWIHALSVGEVRSAWILIQALSERVPYYPLVLSVTTKQGFIMAQQLLGYNNTSIKLFLRPLALPWTVNKILNRLRPSLLCLVEGDIWPSWQWALARKGISCLLVNARISPRTYRNYRWGGYLSSAIFLGFDKILVQTNVDKERLLSIGVNSNCLSLGGNLKFDSAFHKLNDFYKISLIQQLGLVNKRVIVAGSTHIKEEDICLSALADLRNIYSNIILFLAPRDINRSGDILKLSEKKNFKSILFSKVKSLDGYEVVILDILGKLTEIYALAEIAFVGGSLVDVGGHNLLEPAVQGVPVIFGPYIYNFLEIASGLEKIGGGICINSSIDLVNVWNFMLKNQIYTQSMGRAALYFCENNKGALIRILNEIVVLLNKV